ncbi:MAG: MBL fold metallo-hydrolase [Elusimicrobia bacterium]|nr:MBL fold metallo-hydrolase [Elusimicrobiota bacterium]
MPVYVHPNELDYLDKGAPRGLFLDVPRDHVKRSNAGTVLTLGATKITFLHTPGHTPGSQCFLVNDRLIAGDTLFLGTCGRCDLPGSSPKDLFESLNGSSANFPTKRSSTRGTTTPAGASAPPGEEKKHNRFSARTGSMNFSVWPGSDFGRLPTGRTHWTDQDVRPPVFGGTAGTESQEFVRGFCARAVSSTPGGQTHWTDRGRSPHAVWRDSGNRKPRIRARFLRTGG